MCPAAYGMMIYEFTKKNTGSWTRTNDLGVMSPARSHCAIPVNM